MSGEDTRLNNVGAENHSEVMLPRGVVYVPGVNMGVLGGRMFCVSVCEICSVVQLDLNKDQLVLSKIVGEFRL